MFAQNTLMLNLDEKKKILEILESKDACIRDLQNQLDSNNEVISEIEQKLLKTQGLLKNMESDNEQKYRDQITELNDTIKNQREVESDLRKEIAAGKEHVTSLTEIMNYERNKHNAEIQELQGRESLVINRLQLWSDKYAKLESENEMLKQKLLDKERELLEKNMLIEQSQNHSIEERDKNLDQLITEQNNTQRLHQLVNEMRKKQDLLMVKVKQSESDLEKSKQCEMELNRANEQREHLSKKLKESKEYIDQLRQEMLGAKSNNAKKVASLESKIVEVNNYAREELGKLKEEYEERLIASSVALEKIMEEKKSIEEHNKLLKTRLAECLDSLQSAKDELELSRRNLSNLEDVFKGKIEQVNEEKREIRLDYQNKIDTIRKLEKEKDEIIDDYQKQINLLRQELGKTEDIEGELVALRLSLSTVKREKDKLLSLIPKKEELIVHLKEKVNQLSGRLKEEKKTFKEEKENLKMKQQEFVNATQASAYAEVLQSVKESDERVKKAVRDSTKKDVMVKEYRAKITALEAKVDEVENYNISLVSKVRELQKRHNATRDYQNLNVRYTDIVKKMEDELMVATKTIEEKNVIIRQYKQRIEKIMKDETTNNAKQKEVVQQLRDDLSTSNKTISEKNKLLLNLKSKLDLALSDEKFKELLILIARRQIDRIHEVTELVDAIETKKYKTRSISPIHSSQSVQNVSLSLLGLTYNEYRDIMECTNPDNVPSKLKTKESTSLESIESFLQTISDRDVPVEELSIHFENIIQTRIEMETKLDTV